jgi:hypothetical protein
LSFLFVAVVKATLLTVLNASSAKLKDLKVWVPLPDLVVNLVTTTGPALGKIK